MSTPIIPSKENPAAKDKTGLPPGKNSNPSQNGSTTPIPRNSIKVDGETDGIVKTSSYKAVVKLAQKIGSQLKEKLGKGKTVLITNMEDIVIKHNYAELIRLELINLNRFQLGQIDNNEKLLESITKSTGSINTPYAFPMVGILALTEAAKAATGLVAYLQQDFEVFGANFELSALSLQLEVARILTDQGVSVRLDRTTIFNDKGDHEPSHILKENLRFEDLRLLELADKAVKSNIRLMNLKEELKKVSVKADSVKKNVAKAILETENLSNYFSEAHKKWFTNKENDYSLIVKLQRILQLMNDVTHILYLGISSSGGIFMTRRGLFLTAKLELYGSAAATFLLTTRTGQIVTAGALQDHSIESIDLYNNKNNDL